MQACLAASTGARRNEILALRWCDRDPVAKTLRIERSLEESRGSVQTFKGPKRDSHKRTIVIDDAAIAPRTTPEIDCRCAGWRRCRLRADKVADRCLDVSNPGQSHAGA